MQSADSDFVLRKDCRLKTSSGAPFLIAGGNCHYLQSWAADSGCRTAVDGVLDFASECGLNTLRIWAFNDGEQAWSAMQTGPGVYSEPGLVGLDYVIAGTKARGLRVMLTLTNYWAPYGGMDAYVDWLEPGAGKRSDVCAEAEARRVVFYESAACREAFLSYVRMLAGRVNTLTGVAYADEPAILAWDLCNEPRCASGNSKPLLAWLQVIAPAVKAMVPRQLLTVGMEGFYGAQHDCGGVDVGEHGTDFSAVFALPELDLAAIHIYADSWLPKAQACHDAECRHFTAAWIESHADAARALNKPLLIEEFGFPVGRNRQQLFADVFQLVERAMEDQSSVVAGSLVWMLAHESYANEDGYNVSRGECDAEVVKAIAAHAAKIKAWNNSAK